MITMRKSFHHRGKQASPLKLSDVLHLDRKCRLRCLFTVRLQGEIGRYLYTLSHLGIPQEGLVIAVSFKMYDEHSEMMEYHRYMHSMYSVC